MQIVERIKSVYQIVGYDKLGAKRVFERHRPKRLLNNDGYGEVDGLLGLTIERILERLAQLGIAGYQLDRIVARVIVQKRDGSRFPRLFGIVERVLAPHELQIQVAVLVRWS